MFLSRNKKNNVYPCKPRFYYINVGLKGVKIILVCFRDECILCRRTKAAASGDCEEKKRKVDSKCSALAR